MINHAVVLKEQPDRKEFKQFILKFKGGFWLDETPIPGYEYGGIENRGAILWLSLDPINEVTEDYDQSQIEWLKKYLGTEPKGVVNLDIRASEKSIKLAHEIEEEIIAKWGGYIDRNDSVPSTMR